MTKNVKRPISILLTIIMILSVFTIIPVTTANATTVTDVLTAEDFAATETTYVDFGEISKGSGAAYAGNSAKNGSNIQLRSKNSNSGIVSSASGGTVQSVKINVASGSYTVNVYGSLTAYSNAEDLFNSSKQGTLIGTCTSTKTITVTGDYEYIGIRAESNTIYLSSVEITWDNGAGSDDPPESPDESTGESSVVSVTDHLDRATTGVTSSSYSSWSGKTVENGSNAVYAGNSAGGNSSIQLRSNNNNSGIVTTASGGKATKVAVAWNSNTYDGRKLDIYGSNTAYEGAYALYAESTRGTLLGSIVCGSSTELVITGDYAYIGLRSNNSAMYFDFIDITWETDEPAVQPTEPTTYTVTWKNWNGSSLGSVTYNEGETPVYSGTPYRDDDENYTYSFSGWDPVPGPLSADATYTAQYTSTRLYTVTWANYDGDPIKTEKYAEGTTPAYSGADPVRPETDDYAYIFSGWNKEITEVTGNVTYTAQFTAKHKYTVTWNNWDDSELYSETLLEGETPSYNGETASKPYDGTSLYSFTGWDPQITAVSGDITYTAQFSAASLSLNGFFLRTDDPSKDFNLNGKWYQYNDNEPAQFEAIGPFDESGSPIQLCGKNVADIDLPDGNATFAHSVYVTGDGSEENPYVFTANYIYKKNSGSVSNGAAVSIDGSTNSSVSTIANPGDGFQAYAKMKITNHQVMFLQHLDDGTITAGSYLGVGNNGTKGAYGTSYSGATASPYTFIDGNDTLYYIGKQDDVYLFSEQLPLNEDFGGGTAVTTYKVTWNNYDDTELMHEFYPEGETPSYKGSDPVKPTDDDYTYTFTGWKKAGDDTLYSDTLENFPAVSDTTVYTAQFAANPRQKYTVTWKNYDGNVLDTEEYLEHATPIYKGVDPAKADDANYYYDFSGWSPTIQKVTGNIDYTAQYTPVPKYTIIWKNWDDTTLDTEYYREGALDPTYKHENPTRPADLEYTYSFAGWEPEVATVVTKNETYVAQYVRTPLINPDTPVLGGTGVLPTDDNKSYEVAGKWYLDKNGNPQTFTQNGAFEENGSTLYLGNAKVSTIDTEKTLAHTVYITGAGTQDDPYIFYTNYLYGNANASNINGNGTTITMNGVHPGDGFYGCARVNVGTGTKVTFMADPETCQETNAGYIGVGKSNYGYHYSSANAATYKGHGPYTFETGKHTLYYLGTNESDALVFTIQPLAAHPDFVAQFTVWWYNGITLLALEQYASGTTPVYKGAEPTKAEDENFTYSFDGWDPHLMPVTRDIIYTAKFKEYPKHPSDPIEDIAWIYPTDGVLQYDLEHMYYLYDGQTLLFPGKGFIEEDGSGHITACGVIVAGIEEYNDADTISEFVHTVYVSGTGSYYDPFVFHPNYEYHGTKSIIANGASLAVGEENIFATSTTIITYPGDRYKGNTRLRVGDTPVKFLPDDEYHQADDRFLGVGETTYGYSYDREVASPYTFSSANDTLYYHGADDYGFVFAEEPAEYQQSFGDPTTYTVTWLDENGDLLETDICYYDDIPSYDGDTPVKPGYSRFTYAFDGWMDEEGATYGEDETMPAVIGDVTYTATYNETETLFVHHSLTLNGDIGVNFYLDVTEEEITTGSGVIVNFEWNVEGNIKRSQYQVTVEGKKVKDGKTYYKATCWVAAAEMTYNIHATATINGVLNQDTDDYSVREYGLTILNAPDNTFAHQDELVDLIKKMLDYGAKAQVFFKRPATGPANEDVDYTMEETHNDQPIVDCITPQMNDMTAGLDELGLVYQGSTIVYLTKTSIRHYYTVEKGASPDFDSIKAAASASGFSYGEKDGMIYFEKKDIAAYNLDQVQTLDLGSGSTYTYSVLDYSRGVLNSATASDSMKQLSMATYWYNDAAKIYFNSINA